MRGNASTMGRIDVYLPCERPEKLLPLGAHDRRAKRDGVVVARMLSDIVSWPGEKVINGKTNTAFSPAPTLAC